MKYTSPEPPAPKPPTPEPTVPLAAEQQLILALESLYAEQLSKDKRRERLSSLAAEYKKQIAEIETLYVNTTLALISGKDEIEQQIVVNELAVGFKISKAILLQRLKTAGQIKKVEEGEAQSKPIPLEIQERANKILEELKLERDLPSRFNKDLRTVGFIANKNLSDGLFVSHGARLLKNSMGFGGHGGAGCGKSDLFIVGKRFLPPEMVLTFTTVTAQSLYYLGNIANMYLLFGEMNPIKDGEDDPRQEGLRQLLSEDKITKLSVDKDEQTGRNARRDLETTGPAVVVFTSVTEPHRWDSQIRSRVSWLAGDESKETTGEVLEAITDAEMANEN